MNSDDDRRSFGGGHWRVQPKWVKAFTVSAAVPAWLVLMAGVFTGKISSSLTTVAIIAFVGVAALQMVFVIRGYWRMDL